MNNKTLRHRFELIGYCCSLLLVFASVLLDCRAEAQGPPETSELAALLKPQLYIDRSRFWDELLDRVGNARYVLIGDATHGSSEFYRLRAAFSRRLIERKGFSVVVLEASWPDAYRINRFIHRDGIDTPAQALETFKKYPGWYWRNEETLDWIQWAERHNAETGPHKVDLYGADLFDLGGAVQALSDAMKTWRPDSLPSVQQTLSCLNRFDGDTDAYGAFVVEHQDRTCEQSTAALLPLIDALPRESSSARDRRLYFDIRMNAKVIVAAEVYFRKLYLEGSNAAWNARERSILDIVGDISEYHKKNGNTPKIIVWAHNSHVGDATATGMAETGESSLGQLFRQSFSPQQVFLLGQLTYQGSLRATDEWGGPSSCKRMTQALPDSIEAAFHKTGATQALLPLPTKDGALNRALKQDLQQRFVGIMYDVDNEIDAHYFTTRLIDQYDAVIFTDTTHPTLSLDDPC